MNVVSIDSMGHSQNQQKHTDNFRNSIGGHHSGPTAGLFKKIIKKATQKTQPSFLPLPPKKVSNLGSSPHFLLI